MDNQNILLPLIPGKSGAQISTIRDIALARLPVRP